MQPYPLDALYSPFAAGGSDVVLYLPRTSDLRQLAEYVKEGDKIRVTHYCLNGASKALCAYFGDFILD
jgi:trimethylguanosine synthase